MKIFFIFIILSSFFYIESSFSYDGCKDKDVEFCLDDDESAPQFNYEKKKTEKSRNKKISRRRTRKKRKRDKAVFFKKGEVKKKLELLDHKKYTDMVVPKKRIAAKKEKSQLINNSGKKVKVVTKVTKKTPRKIIPKKSAWGRWKEKYSNFKTKVIVPKYKRAKIRVKMLWGKYFK